MIDYRKLLVEYILHINHREGVDFLGANYLEKAYQLPGITEEERRALAHCSYEAYERYHLPTGDFSDLIDSIQLQQTALVRALKKGK